MVACDYEVSLVFIRGLFSPPLLLQRREREREKEKRPGGGEGEKKNEVRKGR